MQLQLIERTQINGEDTVVIRYRIERDWHRAIVSTKDAYTLYLDLAEALADVELCDYCGDLVSFEESGGQGVHRVCLEQAIEAGVWLGSARREFEKVIGSRGDANPPPSG